MSGSPGTPGSRAGTPALSGPEATAYRRRGWASLTIRLAAHALVRPRLALDLLRMLWAFRRRRWLREWPFLPLPPPDYVRWRMYTAYGDEHAVPPVDDVIRFARWRREVMHL